jgi:TRAP-type C4-dicarboxylate transport system permease small subunit
MDDGSRRIQVRDPNPVSRLAAPAARTLAILCGWWLMGYAFLTAAEILGRKFLGRSFQGVDEIGGYTLAVVSSLAFTWALIGRSHTRVDFLLGRLGSRPRATLNAIAYVTLAAVAVLAATKGWSALAESIEFKSRSTTPLQVPMWVPQSGWFAGLALFAAVASAMAIHAVYLLIRRHADVNRLYGPLTVEEEIAIETGSIAVAQEKEAAR